MNRALASLSVEGLALHRLAIVAVAACNAAIVLIAGDGQTLRGDEWTYVRRIVDDGLIGGILDPPAAKSKYALPVTLATYAATLEVFGLDTYLPFRIITLVALTAVALLLFELLRRRIGNAAALAAAALTLLLGSSGVVVAISLRVASLISLAAGLGALLAVERRTGRGDRAALGLLALSVGSHPLGIAFVGASALALVARGGRWWRQAWVAVVPGLLALALLSLTPDGGANTAQDPLLERIREAPGFVFELLVVAVSALTGIFQPPFADNADFLTVPGALVTVALLVALLVAFVRARGRRLEILVPAVVLAGLLAGPLLAPGAERAPGVSRYIYPNAVALLLLAGVAASGLRLDGARRRAAITLGTVVFAFAATSNTLALIDAAEDYANDSRHGRAQLTAFDLAGDRGRPGLRLSAPPYRSLLGLRRVYLSPVQYRKVKERYGSPAYSVEELRRQPEPLRRTADISLALALGLEPRRGKPARLPEAPGAIAAGCASRAAGESGRVRVPPEARVVLRVRGSEAELLLGRLADPSFPLGRLSPRHGAVRLAIPETTLDEAWTLAWRASGGDVEACVQSTGISAVGSS